MRLGYWLPAAASLVYAVGCGDTTSPAGPSADAGGNAFDGAFPDPPDGGKSACSGAAGDPAGAAAIEGYMAKLAEPPPIGAFRTQVVDSILRGCAAFGPPAAAAGQWQPSYCWAQMVASIAKESTYKADLVTPDSYGSRPIGGARANDPTIGLLQIRFSSIVHEVAAYAPLGSLACGACTIPADVLARAKEPGDSPYWAVTGPTQNLPLVTDVACNITFGAWSYYAQATSNGNPSAPTYTYQYCDKSATPATSIAGGNLITGLLSHLNGPGGGKGVIANPAELAALKARDGNGFAYIEKIKGDWDRMIGPVAGTHPFFLPLAPDKPRYCR